MRFRKSYCLLIGLVFSNLTGWAQTPRFEKGLLYVKLKTFTSSPKKEPQRTFSFDHPGIRSVRVLQPPSGNARTQSGSILDGLHKIQVDPDLDIDSLIRVFERYPNVQYVEPVYQEQLFYTPDDPELGNGNQPNVDRIGILEAWDITQGSGDLVIGIVDTGLDFNHDDIRNKIHINPNEIPGNGIDDDLNGYMDDYRGYDFADNDTSAQCDFSFHGNGVGGIAGAETDNAIGIAGVGFHTTISPLKIFTSATNTSNNAYEAILYAAENDYDVVNLSWGSEGTFSQANQDIINYAVLEKDLIIIAAAGNTPGDLKFYPASYDHILSVAATNSSDDQKASFSTYNYSVDLTAPGENILTSFDGNGYGRDNGTSYSAPTVAGIAALAKDIYPHLNALQLMELIRVTADDNYQVGNNSNFEGKLGKGRVNAFRALTESQAKSLRAENHQISNGIGEYAYYGDTLRVSFDVMSFLHHVDAAAISFSTPSPYINVLNTSYLVGAMDTFEIHSFNEALLFIDPSTPPETPFSIRLDYADEDYEDFQYFEFETAPDHLDFGSTSLQLTMAGNGNLGYPEDGLNNGIGLVWNGQQVASQLGFLVGTSHEQVSDNLPEEPLSVVRSKDFAVQKWIKPVRPEQSDYQTKNAFEDSTGILIRQKAFAFDDKDFIILEYQIINTSADTLYPLTSGLYVDWGIGPVNQNRAYFDSANLTLYAQDQNQTTFGGYRIYGDLTPIHQALDVDAFAGNFTDIDDLSDSIKFRLSSESLFDSAGNISTGNNIATLLAHDSLTLAPAQSQTVAFLIAVGESLALVNELLDTADSSYLEILKHPPLAQTLVSCEGASLDINPEGGHLFRFYSDPFATELIHEGVTLSTGALTSDTSFYIVNLDSGYVGEILRIGVIQVGKVANFVMDPDTLFLDSEVNVVSFLDESFQALDWTWDFGNGVQSSIQNPQVTFSETGTYDVTLSVTNQLGCTGSETKTLLVANRPPVPEISLEPACAYDPIFLQAENTDSLAVYQSAEIGSPVISGEGLILGPFEKDTCFFVSNISGPFESLRTSICMEVNPVSSEFTFLPDTSSSLLAVQFSVVDPRATEYIWYIDGVSSSLASDFSLGLEKDTYQIGLSVRNHIGCTDSTNQEVTFSPSPTPVISPADLCYGSDFKIDPENGTIFGFYADSDLDSLIKRGTSLSIPTVLDTFSIYIVGLDSILPSDPVEVEVVPKFPLINIMSDPDTLYLTEQRTATFSDSSSQLVTWTWHLNSTYLESSPQPVIFIDTAGLYEVVLVGTDELGCTATDTLLYPVYPEREPINPLHVQSASFPLVFPNPTVGSIALRIKSPGELSVMNLAGQVVYRKTIQDQHEINLRQLSAGIYTLFYTTQKTTYTERLIIR